MLDLGDGEAVCFKVESHNHPSAVEPFQGAATGVGGILRDIIAMGARPIALLDGLRFARRRPSFRPRGRRDRRVRKLGRRAHGRRRGRLRRELPRQRARERDVCRAPARRPRHAGRRDRPRQPRRPLRRDHRTRRDRRRVGAREPGARRGRRRQASHRPGRRPVHGQEADRGLGRARRVGPRRVAAGLRRRRPRLLALGDGARLRDRPPARPACRCGRRGWSPGR